MNPEAIIKELAEYLTEVRQASCWSIQEKHAFSLTYLQLKRLSDLHGLDLEEPEED